MISRSSLMTSPGGDTIQILETAEHLRRLGVKVDVALANQRVNYQDYDLLHFFNIIRPSDILVHIRKSKLPYVISPIFVDYAEADRNSPKKIIKLVHLLFGPDAIEYFKVVARAILNGERINSFEYLFLGHLRSVKKIIRSAHLLLPNSNSEYQRLSKKSNLAQKYLVVPNAVNLKIFHSRSSYTRAGVLCVGRIEPRKNQLNLIEAMKSLPYRLTLIGTYSPNHKAYFEQCKTAAGENVVFVGQLTQDELVERYSAAKVHVLASWFETTGLSSLEAAACGCRIVITKKGDTEDYFGNQAFYCEPDKIQSIKQAIIQAYEAGPDIEFEKTIISKYNWTEAATRTLEAYNIALEANQPRK